MESYRFKWKLEADRLEVKVRWSIFIFISVCAGLPALAWSVSDLIHHRKDDLSGEYAGHARTGIFSASRNCVNILETWGRAVSCCNMR